MMPQGRKAQQDKEVRDLQTQLSFLEEEISVLRRKLAESPRQSRVLDERLQEAQANLAAVTGQNERLVSTLREAREQIIALKEEVDRLAQPPSGYGIFLEAREDGTVDIFTGGRKLRVNVSPAVEIEELQRGQEVMLNEALNVVEALEFERKAKSSCSRRCLPTAIRALVVAHADEERIVKLAEPLGTCHLRAGDSLMLDTRRASPTRRSTRPRSRSSSSKRSPTSPTRRSADSGRRST